MPIQAIVGLREAIGCTEHHGQAVVPGQSGVPGVRAAVVINPRKAAAKPFNLPHNPRESELHVSVAELLDWVLLPPAIYTTFPAGWGKLTRSTAGRLQASGMKKGMPDIFVFAPKKVIGIELKVGAAAPTQAQRTMHAALQAVGIRVYVCRSQNQVLMALSDAGIAYHRAHIQEGSTQAEPLHHEPRQSI